MTENKPHYEFRVWAENLALLRKKLERLGQPKETVSKEIYLVSGTTDRCNVKIRSDLVDIKILIEEYRGLQRWKPTLKAGFPLASSVIATQVFPSLELQPPSLSKPEYSMDEFLGEVIATEPAVTRVDVSKTRCQISVGTCQTEFASVTLNNVLRDTVAVESTDPDALLQLVRDLGIAGETNTSYIREIKQVLGVSAVSSLHQFGSR